MKHRIASLAEKKLVGKRLNMSLADAKIGELWRSFMPEHKRIRNKVNQNFISLSVYPPGYFSDFHPSHRFERWAAVEVEDLEEVPEGMEAIVVPAGAYAVFLHKGPAAEFPKTAAYIFGTWLPQSAYELDDRPHFEVMGPFYRPDDPESEEEVWIPIQVK